MARGSAVVIGAAGQIGRAAVRALAEDGWEVTAASRSGGGPGGGSGAARTVRLDRADDAAVAALVGGGCDLLVDVVAYDAAHARQLTGLADRIGSAVVVSTAALYEDDQGRSFDTQAEPDGFPDYPVPIPESHRTVAPGDTTYGTRKAALERELLGAAAALPVTLLRAGAVHGPHCRSPRELYFVKRALDGRTRVPLAYDGASRFHPTHTANLAEAVRLAALRPGSRVLNVGDPEVPTVAGIAAEIGRVTGRRLEPVLVPGAPPAPGVGDTPWSVPRPVILDVRAAAEAIGYRAVTGYAESLPATVAWLTERLRGGDWAEVFPVLARSYGGGDGGLFDYAAEDAWLEGRSAAAGRPPV